MLESIWVPHAEQNSECIQSNHVPAKTEWKKETFNGMIKCLHFHQANKSNQ